MQKYVKGIELFHLPTLMHNSLFINTCMLHYYPRHVSSINMPIFRRTNCFHTAPGIVALCKRLHSTPVESSLLSTGVDGGELPAACPSRSMPVKGVPGTH